MALIVKDRVKQAAAAPGTGTITLGSTPTGFQSFAAVGDTNTTYFAIVDPVSGAWEVNFGVYTLSGTTLTRNATPLSSSNSGALVNFTGAVDVFVTYPSEKAVYEDTVGDVTLPAALNAASLTLTTDLAIVYGGTGQSTANAAFNALAPSQTGNSGKYLTTDGTDTSWAANPLGTVTSVAASVPSFLSIAGSPITTSGTLAFSLSGTALPTTSGGTGLTSFTSGGVVYASSSSALFTGSSLTFDGTNLVSPVFQATSTNAFKTNSNSGQYYHFDNASGNNFMGLSATNILNFYVGGLNSATFTAFGLAVTGTLSATGITTLSAATTPLLLSGAGSSSTTLASNYAIRINAGATAANYGGIFFDGSTAYDSFFGRVPTALSGINDGVGYVTYAGGAPTLRTLFSSTGLAVTGTFSSTLDATIYGLTVGRGAGAVSTNTVVGASAFAANATGADNVAIGRAAGSGATGSYGTYVGSLAGNSSITGNSNTAVGYYAYGSGGSGAFNTAIGQQALYLNTSSSYNTAIGYHANYLNQTGAGQNTSVGAFAMYTNNGGYYNTALGSEAMYYNSTGTNNVAVGFRALQNNSTASYNTAVGHQAAFSNQAGLFITALGYQAGYTTNFVSATNAFNTFLGERSGYANATGDKNTYVGSTSGFYQLGTSNTAVGEGSMFGAVTVSNAILNTSVGRNSMNAVTTGSYNVALGSDALKTTNSGFANVALGYQSAFLNQSGRYLVSIGYQAGYNYNAAETFGSTFVGNSAGSSVSSGVQNTFIGGYSGLYPTGSYNTGVGYQAVKGYAGNATGEYNTGVGGAALANFTSGERNSAVGIASLSGNTSGSNNSAVGMYSLVGNTVASNNVGVGYLSGYLNSLGNANVFLGAYAGYNSNPSTAVSTYNVYIGYNAGASATTGTSNTAVGASAYAQGSAATGSNNTAIGLQALASNTSASNNTAVGFNSLYNTTTGINNNALGYEAGKRLSTGSYNLFVGSRSGSTGLTALTGDSNSCIGEGSGYYLEGAANGNTFLGQNSGSAVTTGTNNVILGRYTGNNNGLDIRASSNYIVLADGSANPRVVVDNFSKVLISSNTGTSGTAFGIANLNSLTMTTSTTVNLPFNTAGAMMIQFYDQGTGNGGMYFATYTGTTILVASQGNMGATAGASSFNCYKTANSHQVTVENNAGITRSLAFAVYAAYL